MKILVGSTAAKHWYPEFREPDDVDYFSNERIEGAETFYHPMLEKFFADEERIAIPNALYTIKVSHAFWELKNGSWPKHMWDAAFFKRNGCVLIPELYDILYAIWEERYGVKKANLNKTPEEFFTATVDRKFDHDSIHRSVAYNEEPMFTEILRDGSSVAVSKDKFFALSHEAKCQLVREECYATSLERMLIPNNYQGSPMAGYSWALRKTITSFSKGWFPLWIVENYEHVRKPDVDYVQVHKDNSDKLILLEGK